MTPERWQQVRRLFDEAVELDGDQRAELLERACHGNSALRAEVEILLQSHTAAGRFIEQPLARLVPPDANGESGKSPQQVGPYAIQQILGRGGMGTVYLATRSDQAFHRQVAIKVLRRDLGSEELLSRFRRERQILANLDHPNIARLLEGGTTGDGRPYLVMEYVEGEPIDRYCTTSRPAITRRLTLFRKVCSAVQFAHQSLIVHRDLKPGNILVNAEGEPKLLDFGIAKLLSPDEFPLPTVTTEPGLAPMTLEYASPEQVGGSAITTASDVYSLGVLLYRLLTGRSPYSGHRSTTVELARAICEVEPERPSRAVLRPIDAEPQGASKEIAASAFGSGSPHVGRHRLSRVLRGDLDNIVLNALSKNPQRRYASAEDLGRDLERYSSDRPIKARPDTLTYRAGKFVRRHRLGVAAAAMVLMTLSGFLMALVIQQERTLREKTRAEIVTASLIDLLETSNPEVARGRDVTAREIMDRIAARLPASLEDEPELLADILVTLGRVYLKLGYYGKARPHLDRAVALRRQVHGQEHFAVATSLVELADLARLNGELAGAESRYSEALEMLGNSKSSDESGAQRCLIGLGKVAQARGELEAAEAWYLGALDRASRLFGEVHQQTAAARHALGGVFFLSGDYPAATEAFSAALSIYREVLPGDHPVVVGLQHDLGLVDQVEGRFGEAEQNFRAVLERQTELYDDAHPSLATVRTNLASVLFDLGQLAEAEELCRQALASRHEIYTGVVSPKVAEATNLLGLIRRGRDDPEEAEACFREALKIWRAASERELPQVAVALVNLASVLAGDHQHDEVEALYREALEITRSALPTEHPRVAEILHHQARLKHQHGDLAHAAQLYRQALGIFRNVYREDHPEVAKATHNLAVVLRLTGAYEESEALYRTVLRTFSAGREGQSADIAIVTKSLAAVLVLQDEHEEAEELTRSALELLADVRPRPFWAADVQSILGAALSGQGRYQEAESLLLDSYDRLIASRGPEGNLTVRTKDRLIALYEAWGKPEQASEYRALESD